MNAQTPIRSSYRDFLIIIFKRKYQIALFFIITVCTVVGITLSQKPIYQATARIVLELGSRNLYALPDSAGGSIVNNRISQVVTEIEFLKSRDLAEKVLNQLGPENIYPWVASDAGESRWFKNRIFQDSAFDNIKKGTQKPSAFEIQLMKLQHNFSIKGISNTNIIKFDFRHTNPEIAAAVVNSYIDIYLDERLQLHRNAQSRTFFKDQSLELKNRLKEAEKNLENFKNENNITDLAEQQRLLLRQISDLRVELNSTLSSEIETESRITLLAKQLRQTPETIAQGEVTDHNQVLISRLEAQLVELQIEEKELLSTYTPQSRMVNNVRERIAIVESKLKEQENKFFQRSSVGVNPTYQLLKEEIFRNQAELQTLTIKKEMLNRQLVEFQSEKDTLNSMETKLNELQQSVDLYRENYRLYQAKFEASRIEDAMDLEKIDDVASLNRAVPPSQPISPNYKLNILLSIIIGGMGGLLWAIIGDFMDDSIENPEDVEKMLQLTVLTSIPESASRKRLDHRKVETLQSDLRIQIP